MAAPLSRSITIKAGSLLLDPKNARIPPDRRSQDQRKLLHALLEFEEVKGLAASIAKLGLFPNERLVVIQDGHRYIVLEGNRRLAAIRLLLNPELAPTKQLVSNFRRLATKISVAELGKIDAVVMKSRIAAAPIIAALHTRRAKKRWVTVQQARFYRELVDEGLSPEDVADELGLPVSEVKAYLRTELLYRIALQQDYPAEVRKKIENPKYPISTLERFLESKVGRKFLGVELDDKHGFVGKVHPERFKAVLAHVASEIATKPGMTRIVNREADFKKYVDDAAAKVSKTKVQGSFTPNEVDAGPEAAATGIDEVKPPRPKRHPKPSSSIIPRDFGCTTKNARVRDIFNELQDIKVATQRNTSGVMLRVLIDVALWRYLKDTGNAQAVTDHCDPRRNRRNKNRTWTPALRDNLSYAVEHQLFPGMTADEYKAVRSLVAKDTDYFITIDGFNEFTHNPVAPPTEADLRALWLRAQPMLQVILNQP